MFFKKKKFYVCSVCGFSRLRGLLYNKDGLPDISLICGCCGFHPGYDDDELGFPLRLIVMSGYRMAWNG